MREKGAGMLACLSPFFEQLIRAAMRRENPEGFSHAGTPFPQVSARCERKRGGHACMPKPVFRTAYKSGDA